MERALQELVWRRAGRRCEYCQVAQEHDRLLFEIDHVIAQNHGGPTRASNLCLACFAGNNHKGPNIAGLDPRTHKLTRLFNPRRHKRDRHFRWSGPRRPDANRSHNYRRPGNQLDYRVAFRQGLIDEGVFPPR